jgi:ATP-dependent DNA ligase
MYEVKVNGYRALLLKDGDKVRIRSRNDKDLTNAYPSVAAAGHAEDRQRAIAAGLINIWPSPVDPAALAFMVKALVAIGNRQLSEPH